jgi:DNA-binding response OmpR family regulator
MSSVRLLVAESGAEIYESILLQLHALTGVELIGSVRYADEALAATRRFRPHLVLLEAGLPGEDWKGLVPQLRARAGGPEVVICTSRAAAVDPDEVRHAGALDIFDVSEVVTRLAALLRGRAEAKP